MPKKFSIEELTEIISLAREVEAAAQALLNRRLQEFEADVSALKNQVENERKAEG